MIPKFRAWLKEELEMQDVLAFDVRGHSFLGIEGTNVRVEGWCDYFEVDKQAVIMQSTGLKDLNGVEIFEGDILFDKHHNPQIGVVVFYEGAFQLLANNMYYPLIQFDGDVEIIGNIHENPKLLEGTE
ncbi:YopX family protein [Enterococcus faecalis]|uniref:YopX family protein n=1 Tax=Enterococcus faecalis TaxID=1351 RepID=UPI002DB6E75D|nr:YopX family protein [Enterococcus faecalis]MEB5927624.1 YopX family protein [Enterococcus faecalis]